MLSLGIAIVRGCDAENWRSRYDWQDDDLRSAFTQGALSRVRIPQGLAGLQLLLTVPALLDLHNSGNVLEQSDDVVKDLAAAIVDGTMDPDHAEAIV
jgi:hypothetical protein